MSVLYEVVIEFCLPLQLLMSDEEQPSEETHELEEFLKEEERTFQIEIEAVLILCPLMLSIC